MLTMRMGVDLPSGTTVASGSVSVPDSQGLPRTVLQTLAHVRAADPVSLMGEQPFSGWSRPSAKDIAPEDRAALSLHGSAPGSERTVLPGQDLDDSGQVSLPCPRPADLPVTPMPIDLSRPAVTDQAVKIHRDPVPSANLFAIDTAKPHVAIPHRRAMEVPYGTLAAWIRPDCVRGWQTLITLTETGSGNDGRLQLSMDSDRVALLLSEPYSGKCHAWVSEKPVFVPGTWTHVALTFDHQGTTLFVDGEPLADRSWCAVQGTLETPSAMVDFSLENTDRPIILGFSGHTAPPGAEAPLSPDSGGDHAAGFCGMPARPFTGWIAGFGLWGGFMPQDALGAAQIGVLAGRRPMQETPLRADKETPVRISRLPLPGRSRETASRSRGPIGGNRAATAPRMGDLPLETHA